jgi:hypothetical protein
VNTPAPPYSSLNLHLCPVVFLNLLIGHRWAGVSTGNKIYMGRPRMCMRWPDNPPGTSSSRGRRRRWMLTSKSGTTTSGDATHAVQFCYQ